MPEDSARQSQLFDHPRAEEICTVWWELFIEAMEAKKLYKRDAEIAAKYYRGPHDFVFSQDATIGEPTFKVTINKVYELVRIFGALLYTDNPSRYVEPRAHGLPEISHILRMYLNYTPGEFGLKYHSKRSIDESLINGRGAIFTGLDQRTGFIRSESVPTRDILIDPTSDTWYAGNYMMRIRRKPLWKIAELFGQEIAQRLVEGGGKASLGHAAIMKGVSDLSVAMGEGGGKDSKFSRMAEVLYTYIEVYSKMGIGLRAVKSDPLALSREDEDNLMIVFEPCSKTLMHVGQWTIPFWADEGKHSWPASFYDPAENLDETWPMSPISPALGEQMFLDWAYSFLLGKVRTTGRDVAIAPKDLSAELETALRSGDDVTLVKIDQIDPELRKDLISWIRFPEIRGDILKLIEMVERLFEKRTGLYELLYGASKGIYRSATEAQLKGEYSRIRPGEMLDKVDDWQEEISRKEAVAARWLVTGEQLLPLVGERYAAIWNVYKEGDLEHIQREYQYKLIAGSTRKVTPEFRIERAEKLMARLVPTYMEMGDIEKVNRVLGEWLLALGYANPEDYLLEQLPSPQAGTEGGNQAGEQGGRPPGRPGPAGPTPKGPPEVLEVRDGRPVYGQEGVEGAR